MSRDAVCDDTGHVASSQVHGDVLIRHTVAFFRNPLTRRSVFLKNQVYNAEMPSARCVGGNL
jgi:hypothetical protein